MFTNFEIMRKASTNAVKFFFLQKTITLKNRKGLKSFLNRQIRKEGYELEAVNYIFCSDKYLLDINRQYLGHNYYTDIITFRLSDKDQPLVGEIYISVDRVRDNASRLTENLYIELHRVIFHGALHLCGYKDKSEGEMKTMRRKENDYLAQYFGVSRETVSSGNSAP